MTYDGMHMTDQTVFADDDGVIEFDPDEDIVSYDSSQLDADDLYDVRREAEFINAVALASRIEIERRNILAYDGYQPSFGAHELIDVGMALMAAKRQRMASGTTDRSERITEIADAFMEELDIDAEQMQESIVEDYERIDE